MIRFIYFYGPVKIARFKITDYFGYFCAVKSGIISSD